METVYKNIQPQKSVRVHKFHRLSRWLNSFGTMQQSALLSAVVFSTFFWLVTGFCFPGTASAAPPFAADQSSEHTTLTPYLDLLEDSSGQLGIEDVTTDAHIHRFAPIDRPNLNFGFTRSTYWLRFTALNASNRVLYRAFELSPATIDSIHFYQLDQDTPGRITWAEKFPVAEYFAESATKVYGLKLEPDSRTAFYLRVQSGGQLNLDVSTSSINHFVDLLIIKNSLMSMATGALLLMCVLNLLFSIILKQRLFLYHCAYLLAMIVYVLASNGFLVRYFLPGSNWAHQSIPLTTFVMNIMALLFVSQAYKSWPLPKHLQQILQLFIALNLTSLLVVNSLGNSILSTWSHLVFVLSLFTVIAFSLYLYVQTNSLFNLHLALARFCIVFSILSGLYCAHTGILSHNQITILMTAGLIIDAVIVSLALQLLTKEKAEQDNHYQHRLALAEAEYLARDEILERINHNIRTPVSGILGMAELLKDTSLSANQKDYLETLEKSSHELLDYIHEIQDFSRLQSGNLRLHNAKFDLAALVSSCLNGFCMQAEARHIELICDIQPEVPSWVLGDAGRIRQILLHLLRNAINHTEQGEVILSLQQNDQDIQFAISDSGSGISRQQIRELMATSQKDYPFKEDHYTLGFLIARQLVSAMGGKLSITSELGHGSTALFTLPLPRQTPQPQEMSPPERILRGRRLLIVDDNEACRKVIIQQANGWGMLTMAAHSGSEALASLKAQANIGCPFDIVLIDQGMPIMSGLQLAYRIQQDAELDSSKMVLIMLTGLSDAPDPAIIRQTGIVRILVKPVSSKTLRVVLTEELSYMERSNTRPTVPETPSDTPPQYPAHILIAEDDRISVKVLKAMLGKLGATCYVASNGQHAFEAVQMNRYDLILMDCEMPIMDGFEATRHIRQWEQDTGHRPIPIIALTAHTMDEHKEKSQLAGMDAHMAKPINIGELETMLRRWVT